MPIWDRLTYMDQLLVLHAVAVIVLTLGVLGTLYALVHLCTFGTGPEQEEDE